MSTTNGERYWLLERRHCRSLVANERWVLDHFVCCEVIVDGDAAVALEVFTSREGAEAEVRGMETLRREAGFSAALAKAEGD